MPRRSSILPRLKKIWDSWERFWQALAGVNLNQEVVPVNYENINPIPVVPVYHYGGDIDDKNPVLHSPVSKAGFNRTKTTNFRPLEQQPAVTAEITSAGNIEIAATGTWFKILQIDNTGAAVGTIKILNEDAAASDGNTIYADTLNSGTYDPHLEAWPMYGPLWAISTASTFRISYMEWTLTQDTDVS